MAWPFVALGCGYACLGLGLLVTGARRQRDLEASLQGDTHRTLGPGLVTVFTSGGVLLAVATIVLVVAQS